MDHPQELEVDEDAEIVERVAAIDVAKATGMVCTRVPHASIPGKRVTKVWEVKATTKGITELAEHLVKERVERVVLESTSDCWRCFLYVLEGAGLTVWLVNAKQVRNVPGRPKTDKLDSIWLAKLAERQMLSPSFVPREQMRHVRDLARARFDLVGDRSRVKQRVEKVLEDALLTELREEMGWPVAFTLGPVATVPPRVRANRRHARPRETGRAPPRRSPHDCGSLPSVPARRSRRHGDRPSLRLPARATGVRPTGDDPALLRDGPASLLPVPVGDRSLVERGHPRRGTRLLLVDPARRQAATPSSRCAAVGGAPIEP
jgi:hypothetical protein